MRNPLNAPDVSGNSMQYMAEQDRQNAASHEDQYFCGNCGDIISTKQHEKCELCHVCEDNEIMGMKFGGV